MLLAVVFAALALVGLIAWTAAPLLKLRRPPEPQSPDLGAHLHALLAQERARLVNLADEAPPEPAHMEDEADTTPRPEPAPAKRPRGGPRKASGAAGIPTAAPASARRAPVATLATALRLPVQFRYRGGHNPGETRQAVIVSACGHIESDGGFDVTTLRCICGTAKTWRAFRLDLMSDLVDMRTGEVITAAKPWITHILNQTV